MSLSQLGGIQQGVSSPPLKHNYVRYKEKTRSSMSRPVITQRQCHRRRAGGAAISRQRPNRPLASRSFSLNSGLVRVGMYTALTGYLPSAAYVVCFMVLVLRSLSVSFGYSLGRVWIHTCRHSVRRGLEPPGYVRTIPPFRRAVMARRPMKSSG